MVILYRFFSYKRSDKVIENHGTGWLCHGQTTTQRVFLLRLLKLLKLLKLLLINLLKTLLSDLNLTSWLILRINKLNIYSSSHINAKATFKSNLSSISTELSLFISYAYMLSFKKKPLFSKNLSTLQIYMAPFNL